MSQLSEKVNKLLKRIRNGDKACFKSLHEITYNHLTVVAMNYLYNTEEVEDVLNESYSRVYYYISSFDNKRDGYNWMCKIVQNVAYSYNKKYNNSADINKIKTHELFYELEDDIVENTLLFQAIRLLDGEKQELVYLKFWEDLSFSEIAALKGMKKSTVYKKITTAMKLIKKFLDEW